jgi:cell division protein FtsB
VEKKAEPENGSDQDGDKDSKMKRSQSRGGKKPARSESQGAAALKKRSSSKEVKMQDGSESPSTAPTQAYQGAEALDLANGNDETIAQLKAEHAEELTKRDKLAKDSANEIDALAKELKKVNKQLDSKNQEVKSLQQEVKDLAGQLKASEKRIAELEKKQFVASKALSMAGKAMKGEVDPETSSQALTQLARNDSSANANSSSSNSNKRTRSAGGRKRKAEDGDEETESEKKDKQSNSNSNSNSGKSPSPDSQQTQPINSQGTGGLDDQATIPMSFSMDLDPPSRRSSSGLKRQRTASKGRL